MAGVKIISLAEDEPVSVDDVKEFLRVEYDDDDALLTKLIIPARQWVELRTGYKFAQDVWEISADTFPASEFSIPMSPVASVESVKYDDENGNEQTVDPDNYYLDNSSSSHSAWIMPTVAWPTTLVAANAVRARYVVGYSEAALIPAPIIAAIQLKVLELYDGENRTPAIDTLLSNYLSLVA